MAKPRPLLGDMPIHIKEKIVKEVSLLDRCALRRSNKEWNSIVDRCQKMEFEKFFLVIDENCFELIFKQNNKFICLKYVENEDSIDVVKTVNGNKTSRIITQLKLSDVCDQIFKHILVKEQLKIENFIIAELTAGGHLSSASFRLRFTKTLQAILGNRRQRLRAANFGLFTSSAHSYRYQYIWEMLSLEYLSAINLQVMNMEKYRKKYHRILSCESKLDRLNLDALLSIGLTNRSETEADISTTMSQADFWRHTITSKLKVRETINILDSIQLDEVNNNTSDESRNVYHEMGVYIGEYPNYHFQLQIYQNRPPQVTL